MTSRASVCVWVVAFVLLVGVVIFLQEWPPWSVDAKTRVVGVSPAGVLTGTVQELRSGKACTLRTARETGASSIDWVSRKLYFVTRQPDGIWEWQLSSGQVSQIDDEPAHFVVSNNGRIAVVRRSSEGGCELFVGSPDDDELSTWGSVACTARVALGADRVWLEESGKIREVRGDAQQRTVTGTAAVFDPSGTRMAYVDSSGRLVVYDLREGSTRPLSRIHLYEGISPSVGWSEDGSVSAATTAPRFMVDDAICRPFPVGSGFPCPEIDRYTLSSARERIYSGTRTNFAWITVAHTPCPLLLHP